MSANVGGGKKGTIILNLTSMIDVSAIIIIFLVMGTVFGPSAIEAPPEIKFPKSFNKDIVDNAPQVIIKADKIDITFLHRDVELNYVLDNNEEKLKVLKAEIKNYIENMPESARAGGILLNIIADKAAPYKVIYEVSSFFRQNGFQSMLFVAEGN